MNKESVIVVTGGTGFLGSHILRGLVEKGFSRIKALRRSGSRMELVSDIAKDISWVEGDILDINSVEELLSDADVVIHNAAKVSYNPKHAETLFKVNMEGTANMVNLALGKSIEKFIYISSVAAIGRNNSSKIITEKNEWNPDGVYSNYAYSKHHAELEVWRGMTEGLNIGILNPSMILGPSYWGESSTKLFTYVANRRKFYPGGLNGFVDVRDVARLTINYMTSEVKNERIIAVGENMRYKSLLTLIAKALDVPSPNIPVKQWMANMLWRIQFLSKDPTITKETARITNGVHEYDHSKSLDLLGHQYIPVHQSVKDTAELYLRSQSEGKNYAYFDKIFDE